MTATGSTNISISSQLRHALVVALKALEALPEQLRPESDMDDMRGLIAGESSGRDGFVIAEAVAKALASMTQGLITDPLVLKSWPDNDRDREQYADAYNTRMDELTELFELVNQCKPQGLGHLYMAACNRLGMTGMVQAMVSRGSAPKPRP